MTGRRRTCLHSDLNIGSATLWVRMGRHQTALRAVKEPGLGSNLCCEAVDIADSLDVGSENIMFGCFVGSVVFGVDFTGQSSQSL